MNKKLLIVDDNETIRAQLKENFKNTEIYEVFEASSGQEALSLAKKIVPDIITLNHELPKMNGIETCRKLLNIQELEDVPILMFSSKSTYELKKAAFEAGIYEFFNKSSDLKLIIQYINNYFIQRDSAEFGSKICVVMDSKFISDNIKKLLLAAGYRPKFFLNSEDFINHMNADNEIDLVIADIYQPEMTGIELIRKVRQKYALDELPIIVISGIDLNSIVIAAFINGANDFLVSPFQGKELFVRLNTHLKLHFLQKALSNKNDEFKKINDVKNTFIGVAAHELRNPLAIIREAGKLINEGVVSNEEKYKLYKMIDTHSQRMLIMLEDLLSMNKMESGKIFIKKQKVSSKKFLQEILEFNLILAKKKQITINLNQKIEERELLIDVDKITQVFNNLISNAIKYSPVNSHVDINVFPVGDAGFKIEVIDQAMGIKKEEQDRVFQAFSKISNRPTEGESTTGLGLAICERIVEAHGGRIGFESKYGTGSTFWFEI